MHRHRSGLGSARLRCAAARAVPRPRATPRVPPRRGPCRGPRRGNASANQRPGPSWSPHSSSLAALAHQVSSMCKGTAGMGPRATLRTRESTPGIPRILPGLSTHPEVSVVWRSLTTESSPTEPLARQTKLRTHAFGLPTPQAATAGTYTTSEAGP